MLSPVGKTNRYNKLMWHWQNSWRQNEARRNQTGTDLYGTVCSVACLVSSEELELAIHLPISPSPCLKETQYISIMCAHMRQRTPQGCLPCNSLLRYAILPLGQSQHYYPGHTPYLPPTADITICETQGELAVFHTQPPPSLISSHYTNVRLALLIQTPFKFTAYMWTYTAFKQIL